MGVYTATKSFVRKLPGVSIRQERGDWLQVDRYDEAEALLGQGVIVEGKQYLKAPVVRDTAQSDAYRKVVDGLAKEVGLTFGGCDAKIKRLIQPDVNTGEEMPLDEAIARIREEFGLTDGIDKIGLLAADLGVDQATVNEMVAGVIEERGCNIDEAIAVLRAGQPAAADAGDGQELKEGSRVIAEYEGELRTGTVVKVCDTEVRVKIDQDEKEYRRLGRDKVELFTDEG